MGADLPEPGGAAEIRSSQVGGRGAAGTAVRAEADAAKPKGGESPIGSRTAATRRNPDGGSRTPGREVAAVGPIIGVRSKSSEKSNLIFYGHEHYNEWQFTEELLRGTNTQPAQRRGGRPRPGRGRPPGCPNFSIRWLGALPCPSPHQGGQPQDGTLPDGSTPGVAKPAALRPATAGRPRGATLGQPADLTS